ncbi:MAG: hypothetical protein AMQ22_02058 [Candidatus Methanofastidiosum methylothiophilum]|uniref:Uncharacterized protein n=1 Tax=Candidatus Methanofastidiosum methylothiophilum TaxID=1705564 RepID=A0A150IQ31_9EURY|nr:MAG: hypothetical protein AMQ22_02058 [Candidatus Methanofastidiosum methylthiophilus]
MNLELNKEKASEMFGVSGKNVQHFKIDTPDKNHVEGWICKSRQSNMGSLIIDTVNFVKTWQFVRGMPKLQYLDERDEPTLPTILHKEDGTNIVMFPLLFNEGEYAETLFKTRLMPYCNDNWLVKIKEVITNNHYKAVEKECLSFSYELYGIQNKHEVQYQYQDIPELNLDLLTVLMHGKSLPYKEMSEIAKKYNLSTALKAFEILHAEYYNAYLTTEFIDRFDDYVEDPVIRSKTLEGLYNECENFFEKMNMKFQDKHQRGIITEGSVWHYGLEENHMKKCKAISVREGHIKQACGIPHHDIRKAIVKVDENSEKDLSETPIVYILTGVKDELSEEYDKIMIDDKRTEDKIKSVLGKYLRKVHIDAEMEQIIQRIHNEIDPDSSPADKMRVFAQLYPNMRKQSRTVYQALVSM